MLLLLLFLTATANPQTQPPQLTYSKLPADHPILHDTFFNLTANLESFHAQRKAQSSGAQLAQVDRDFANVFKIDSAELERFFQITRAATAEIKAIEDQMVRHGNERARLELYPDPATMQTLETRRKSAIQSNLNRLRTTLSPTAWAAVSNYINTDLRNSVTFAQPAGKKP